ncbi:NINE protein [Gloeocapsa sp. PCC 73106]|uniref:NINE protein n=1 Tax=Gloeocapsa sp. PCC 73106 TaxID=102232 RepID=UPI0002AC8405|nr:NINE protein [Gloeocapsa sp. PCC 73106]ELR97938.1 putative membrane protein [Gloeocapsa sp. PCC 73106]
MQRILTWLKQPKRRHIAIILAFLGVISPIPLAGLHKFYLGQPVWGLVYLLLWSTPIPRIAATIDGVWYFFQSEEQFNLCFNQIITSTGLIFVTPMEPSQVQAIAQTIRELAQLKEDGLISEGEFEQKRRQLLERIF